MKQYDPRQAISLGECTPSREQTWLLQTAVLSDDTARYAWQEWCAHINLDDVDPASYRLLPLVYRNLLRLGVEDPLLKRMKGVYRHTWYKNQMLFHQAQHILDAFQNANIRTMLLKGAAMSARYYQDNGARFMNDIDLMVPQAQFKHAAQIMLQQNWQPKFMTAEEMYSRNQHQLTHASGFEKDTNELDLHHSLLPFVHQSPNVYWENAICHNWCGQTIYLLSPTDQVFHTCVHGMNWSYGYLSWIPDVLVLLNAAEEKIVWQLLIQRAQETRMIIPLRNALAYLAKMFQAPVPNMVLQQLYNIPVNWIEKQEYKVLTHSKIIRKPVLELKQRIKMHFRMACRYQAFEKESQKAVVLSLTGWARYFL